jgi:hypothetical protein
MRYFGASFLRKNAHSPQLFQCLAADCCINCVGDIDWREI